MQRITKKLFNETLRDFCKTGLIEDDYHQDITSDLTILDNTQINFQIRSRQNIVLCGTDAIKICFDHLLQSEKFKSKNLRFTLHHQDGELIKNKTSIASGTGDAKLILAAERVILNTLQHLSAIATNTHDFVKKLNNPAIKILDTRKTIPGLRILQKYAVKTGSGQNHRFNLSDAILIKDNHIVAANGVKNAIQLAKKSKLTIEIECDNLKQVKEAIAHRPHIIMLDNMDVKTIQEAVKIIDKKAKIEVSGNVNMDSIKKYSKLDIDFISIGALTHSVKAVDIGLDTKIIK